MKTLWEKDKMLLISLPLWGHWNSGLLGTVKPVLETNCIKRPPAIRDLCFDTTLLKLT